MAFNSSSTSRSCAVRDLSFAICIIIVRRIIFCIESVVYHSNGVAFGCDKRAMVAQRVRYSEARHFEDQ